MGESPRKPTRPHASAVLTDRRVGELLRIRLDGAEWWDVCEYVRSKEAEEGSAWALPRGASPMSESQIRRLMAKADALVFASHERSRKKLFRRHLAQRRNLYAKAVLAGDYRTALACAADEAEMLGLYPPKRTQNEHSGPGGEPLPVAFIEVPRDGSSATAPPGAAPDPEGRPA